MKHLILALGFVALQQQDPAHPFPNHEMPPNGWYCVPAESAEQLKTDAHACDCLGMVDDPMCTTMGEDENGQPVELPRSNDNSKCRVYCHRDHCACEQQCHGS